MLANPCLTSRSSLDITTIMTAQHPLGTSCAARPEFPVFWESCTPRGQMITHNSRASRRAPEPPGKVTYPLCQRSLAELLRQSEASISYLGRIPATFVRIRYTLVLAVR